MKYLMPGSAILVLSFTAAAIIATRPTQTASLPSRSASTPTPSPSSTPAPTTPDQQLQTGGSQIFQTFNNCGPASLSMALSYFGIAVTQAQLGQSLRPHQHPQGQFDDKSVTLTELAAKAGEYGLLAYHRPAGTIDHLQAFLNLGLPVITRTLLEEADDIGHYRVVKGYHQPDRVIIQDDSLQGADLRITYERFQQLWQPFNYEFLLLVPPSKKTAVETALGDLLDPQQAWAQALAQSDTVLNGQANHPQALFNRSVALYHLGRYQESVDAYQAAAPHLPPKTLWYQLEPLLAYYRLQDDSTLLTLTQKILEGPNRAYSELYQLRGLVYQRQGQTVLADQAFAQANTYNHSHGYWLKNLTSL